MAEQNNCCENNEKKEVKTECCCGGDKILILACSGGSNVGQISNNVMIELDKKGIGSSFCLAGVGGNLSGFIQSAKSAKNILIDGCPLACGLAIFKNHNIQPYKYFVITELGIKKNHNFDKLKEETEEALTKIINKLE
ncbi:MAG TPA: putative zinc-binding protein [bacterium]|nr:putative zinc-binding protein [bacterium]HOL48258.1 putative zinc-binding protein [bacterium]HPQ18432.1 putative zinc-binding protein [bacterium]